MMPTPQPVAAMQTAAPWRWTWPVQPLVAVAISDPTAGAAKRRPSAPAPPRSEATAGKSASGIPKSIATMSTAYVPMSSGRRAGVAGALDDAAPARGLRLGRRRDGAHHPERDERDDEGRHVDAVGGGEADRGDEDAGDGGPGDHPDRHAKRRERAGGGHLVALDEARGERLERRALEPVEHRHDGGEHEDHPEPRLRRSAFTTRAADAPANASSVICIIRRRSTASAMRAADQRAPQERHELDGAQEADDERRVADLVGLERERDVGDHRAQERDALADEEQPEVAVPPKRPDVHRGPVSSRRAPVGLIGGPGPSRSASASLGRGRPGSRPRRICGAAPWRGGELIEPRSVRRNGPRRRCRPR